MDYILWFETDTTRVEKKPGLFVKKNSSVGFFCVFLFFLVFLYIWLICPEERVFWVFSVSRILLGASIL
jgi:hypothetical protein